MKLILFEHVVTMDLQNALLSYLTKIFGCESGDKILLLDDYTTQIMSLVISFTEIIKKDIFLVGNVKTIEIQKQLHIPIIIIITPESISELVKILKCSTVKNIHLYLTESITKNHLIDIAKFDIYNKIVNITEMYINYQPIEQFIFLVKKRTDLLHVLLSLKCYPANLITDKFEINTELNSIMAPHGFRPRPNEYFLTYNRNDDPITPLLCSWDYVSLLHNQFEIINNRIKYINSDKKQTEIIMSSKEDAFFNENKFELYDKLIENTLKLRDQYNKEIERLEKCLENNTTDDIKKIIDSLRDHKRLKENTSKHFTLQTILSENINSQILQSIVEQEMLYPKFLLDFTFYQKNKKGNEKDKMIAQKIELKILYYLKNHKFFDDSLDPQLQQNLEKINKTYDIKEKQNSSGLDRYEPYLARLLNKFSKNNNYTTIIIYVEGGGTYAEAKLAYEFGKKHSLNVIFGSTHMLNKKMFIQQLSK